MNYLKKKLKAHNKPKHDDDDDYDNYIPPVPPHPSTITQDQTSNDNTTEPLPEPEVSAEELLQQLKEKEISRKKEEREKIKENEESKKDREDWKFFLSLTAKVEDITSKTQSALEKLKDSSAIDEIINKSDYDYVLDNDQNAPKPAGSWIAFSEDGLQNTSLKDYSETKESEPIEEPKSHQQITEEELKKVAETPIQKAETLVASKLLDDFGFNEEPEVIPVAYQPVVFEEEDYLDDPFDTSFVDVSTVAPKAAAEVIQSIDTQLVNCDFEVDSEPDPFDTSYVESAISGQSVVKPDSIDITPIETPATLPDYSSTRISRCSSRDSIMSNPFLTDLNDYYTPYASGAHTPYSGTATPKRRNSTNPFEQSPEEEETVVMSAQFEGQSPVASAIADMTADFYNTITSKSLEPSLPSEPLTKRESEPTSPPFDPFATIHDDDTPKRQSLGEENNTINSKNFSPEAIDPFARQPIDGISSPPLPPPDCSFLAAKVDNNDYLSDLSDIEDNIDDNYDNINNNKSINNNFGAINGLNRKNSAFQMELLSGDKDLPLPTFEPLPASTILQRKQSLPILEPEELINISNSYHEELESNSRKNSYFDPFETVFDKDAEEVNETLFEIQTEVIEEKFHPKLVRKLSTQDSISDIGQPNKNATGIVNDAFDEKGIEDELKDKDLIHPSGSIEDYNYGAIDADSSGREYDIEDGTSETNALHDGSVTTNTNTNVITFGATTDSGVVIASNFDDITDCGKDPFDTSEFDSAAFDAFATKFDATAGTADNSSSYDPFASPMKSITKKQDDSETDGFDIFDPFARQSLKTPKNTPAKIVKDSSKDSFDDEESDNLKIVIRAKMKENIQPNAVSLAPPPLLPPPPKSPKSPALEGLDLMPDEDNPIDEFEAFFGSGQLSEAAQHVQPIGGEPEWPTAFGEAATKRTDSTESPQTPLFDEDTSQPLEDFPTKYKGEGWEMMLRHPNKKKLTANRFWKKIFVKFMTDTCVFQLFNKKEDNNPFQETPLQASYSLSDISTQQYDQYGKIFTIKLQYIFYRERVGVRPGQIAKVMQGQITSMGQFAKLGMPLEHSPQVSELLKFGTQNYTDLKEIQQVVEESLFRMSIHRDRALTYKTEEIQCCVQDELFVEQNKMGIITKQLARVRIFFLAFVNGMPTIEVGINDMRRQGKEVVGRHDIIPVVTEEWIRLEAWDFHCCVQPEDFEMTQIIKLIPPDACHFELMRFRIRPPKNRELPLQVSANLNITKSKVELKCDVLVPGCISRKHGQIPCEDIQIRFYIPECWIYFFRVEKHFRYGALKSAHRRTGKIKGIERILGSTQNSEPQLIEVTAGQAKYEHAFHSIVWRIPRLPKEGQGAYTQQLLFLRLPLTSFDQIPESFYESIHVEFKMPSTTVSHTTLRSISVSNENPPEKFVRYLAKYEYKIELNITFDEKTEVEYIANVANVANNNIKQSQDNTNKNVKQEDKDSDESD